MKIGILTLPLHTNYGGILQAYALQTVLERMGHEVVVFNKKANLPILPSYKKPLYYSARFIKKILVNPHAIVRRETIARNEYPIVSQYTQRFINQYIQCYWINGIQDIEKAKLDAMVVGSDQIWRPRYFVRMWKSDIADAFLAFTEKWDIKRYAYAASFGVSECEYPQEIKGVLREAARRFNAISVREKSGIDLCRNYFDVSAIQVLDPTMLLAKEDYIELVEKGRQPKSTGDIFCYILDSTPDKEGLVSRIAREKQLTPFHVKAERMEKTKTLEERIHKPVEAWIRGFYDAKFIITDSFHACVFSILFGKPFIVVGNKGRGFTRFSSLLDMFSLKKNLISSVSEYNPDEDYCVLDTTRDVVNKLRKESIAFLNQIR